MHYNTEHIHASHALSFHTNCCLDSCVSIFYCVENEIRDDLLFEFDNIVVIILSGRVLYAV